MIFGRTQHVIGLMVVWAAALVGIDKTLNHSPATVKPVSGMGKPQLTVTFTHFCCSGCYDKMFSAAKSMSWIVTATTDRSTMKKQEEMQKEKVDEATQLETKFEKDAVLLLDETDLKSVDMVKVTREFDDAGLVAKHMILEHVPHFKLIAVGAHLCCGLCKGAATNAMKAEQTNAQAKAKVDDPTLDETTIKAQYMPSYSVDLAKQQISAEFYEKADVTNFTHAMARAGFSPKEIRIEILEGAK